MKKPKKDYPKPKGKPQTFGDEDPPPPPLHPPKPPDEEDEDCGGIGQPPCEP